VQKFFSSSLLYKNLKINIYRIVILSAVLYGCEAWSLALREEYRLRVLDNRVLREVFGSKRDEETGEWRRLHNGELYGLYASSNIIRVIKSRRMRWTRIVARVGDRRGTYSGLWESLRERLGRPRYGWEYAIKMTLQEVGLGGMDWIDLAQDRDRWWAVV
jgi:hypothetical protein